MKRVIIFIVFVSIATVLFAQTDFFYTDKGVKETFKVRKDKVILRVQSAEKAKTLVKETVFRSAYDVGDWVIVAVDTLQVNLEKLKQRQGIVDAAYALEYADGTLQMPTNRLYVKFKEGQSPESVLGITGLSKSVETIELFNKNHKGYIITLNVPLGDILRISRNLFETGMYICVVPIFKLEMKPHNTHYHNQWGFKNTGQSGGTAGIDIKAEQAWAITRGSREIRVAVIDEGVHLTHPDLQFNILQGFDAVPNIDNPGGANGSHFGTNAHGTACAGIIAAFNNSIGIVGVASNVRIIPIRIAYTPAGDNIWTTDETWIANGINHAWQTAQADILNCSWGGGADKLLVTDAINEAVTNGRLQSNGTRLGCVVVASSGNGINGIPMSVGYPASLPNVLSVGAIDRNGQRASFSNYGSNLDVVAPGVDIYTTGILNAPGYNIINNGTSGVYFSDFTGTSAACPHVAGIAALILSVRPDLSEAQVRDAIIFNCTKLSAYPHPGLLGWNEQVGFGLVNAYEAVRSIAPPRISGPNTVCYTGEYFELEFLPPQGTTITWTVTGPFSFHPTSLQTSATGNNVRLFRTVSVGVSGGLTVSFSDGNSTVYASKTITACSSADIVGPNEVSYDGNQFYLNYLQPAGTTITWNITGPFTPSSATGKNITIARTGTSTNSGTMTAYLNSIAVASKTITPCPPISIRISGPNGVCDEAVFTVIGAPVGFNWDSSPNITLGAIFPHPLGIYVKAYENYTYSNSGNNSGWIRVMHNGVELARKDLPQVGHSQFMVNGPASVGLGTTATYYVTVNPMRPQPVGYSWGVSSLNSVYGGDTIAISPWAANNGYSAPHTFTNYGTYRIICTAYSAGCTKSESKIVSVGSSYAPSSSPSSSPVSTHSAYPNPVANHLTIEIDADAAIEVRTKPDLTYDVRLYDGQGNLLRQTKTKGGKVEFNVSNLRTGAYFLHIYDGVSEKPNMQLIVVER